MEFTKMHGTGNDFIVVDAQGLEQDWPSLARRLCDRHVGVGADGLLLVLPSRSAAFRMGIFNADGSEAEMCGNGIRCFAKYVLDKGLWPLHTPEFTVETLGGIKHIQVTVNQGRGREVRVGMGEPQCAPQAIGLRQDGEGWNILDINKNITFSLPLGGEMALPMHCVSMGNPHAVTFIGTPVESYPLERIGPMVEHHPLFLNRANFEVVRVLDREQLEMRVWERGVGETMACGTGACAAMVVAHQEGLVGDEVRVSLPGGELTISWLGFGEVFLQGPAQRVFHGIYDDEAG